MLTPDLVNSKSRIIIARPTAAPSRIEGFTIGLKREGSFLVSRYSSRKGSPRPSFLESVQAIALYEKHQFPLKIRVVVKAESHIFCYVFRAISEGLITL